MKLKVSSLLMPLLQHIPNGSEPLRVHVGTRRTVSLLSAGSIFRRSSAGSILQIEPQRLALARRAGTGQGVAKVGNTHHNPNVPGPGTHR